MDEKLLVNDNGLSEKENGEEIVGDGDTSVEESDFEELAGTLGGDTGAENVENLVSEGGIRQNAEEEEQMYSPIWYSNEGSEDEDEATQYETSPAAVATTNASPLYGSKRAHLNAVMSSKPTAILGKSEHLGSSPASRYARQFTSCHKALCDCDWGEF